MVFPEFIREHHFHNRFKKLFLLKSGLKLGELKSRGEQSCWGRELLCLAETFERDGAICQKCISKQKNILIHFFRH